MPARKKPIRDRIDLRAETDFVARITAQARRRQMNISSYIRAAVLRQVEEDEATDPSHRHKLHD